MHTKEQKITKLSMITLFLAIILVYCILFQVKGKSIHQGNNNSGEQILITEATGITNVDQAREEFTTLTGQTPSTSITTGMGPNIQTGTTLTQTHIEVLPENTVPQTITGNNITILSGTNIFYGSIESIEKLGIKYQYALIDNKNIYYINLGNPTYDFASIARKLGGNLYEIKTEAELAQNKLFGDKVIYINLPEYKEKRVLLLVYIKNQVRLLQIDYAIYHKTKSYIKSLFIQ